MACRQVPKPPWPGRPAVPTAQLSQRRGWVLLKWAVAGLESRNLLGHPQLGSQAGVSQKEWSSGQGWEHRGRGITAWGRQHDKVRSNVRSSLPALGFYSHRSWRLKTRASPPSEAGAGQLVSSVRRGSKIRVLPPRESVSS